MKRIILFTFVLVIGSGCATVKPWEKGNLANPYMQFDPDPLEARFARHVQDSKEGTSGGYGVQISACGCN